MNIIFFFSFRPPYFSTWILCLLNCFRLIHPRSLCYLLLPVILPFCTFWILGTVNKAEFSPRKTSMILVKSWPWGECWLLCIRLSLHNEKHYSFICPLTTVIIIFSKVHGNVMLSHAKFQIGTNIFQMCLTFLQYVWVKPHSSSLTNVKNTTNIFRQPVQICCREKIRLN